MAMTTIVLLMYIGFIKGATNPLNATISDLLLALEIEMSIICRMCGGIILMYSATKIAIAGTNVILSLDRDGHLVSRQ